MYKTISYSQDFLGDEDMQVMHCYPENYLLFILDPTASLSNESLILPLNSYLKLIFLKLFLTFYPKHHDISTKIIITTLFRVY